MCTFQFMFFLLCFQVSDDVEQMLVLDEEEEVDFFSSQQQDLDSADSS